jgi:phosphatidylserine synthase 2
MGQHVWLLLATIVTELLVITKWGTGQYPNPLPEHVKWAWVVGAALLVLYPTVTVSILTFVNHYYF